MEIKRKAGLIIIMFLLSSFFIAADEPIAGIDLSYLTSGYWGEYGPFEGAMTYVLLGFSKIKGTGRSNSDITYVLGIESEGGPPVEVGQGTLSISGNTLIFNPIKPAGSLPERMKNTISDPDLPWNRRAAAKIYKNTSSFTFHEYIGFDGSDIRLYNRKKQIKNGDRFNFKGIPLVVIQQRGEVIESVRIRNAPSLSGDPVDISPFNETFSKNYPPGRTYIEPGEKVFIMARTTEKVKIGEWNNYWYMLSLTRKIFAHYSLGEKVWAYAEFIDLE